MISSANDLSTHLLGQDDEHDPDCDEEEGCMPCSVKILYEEELEDSQSSSDNGHSIFLSYVLHFLLFETFFDVAVYVSPVWLKVNCSIILFVFISSVYKKVIKDCKPTCSAVVLLPELLQIIILSLTIFDKVVAALLLLMISNLCLAVLAAASSIRSFVVMAASINRKMELK
jgi:hypothetical protein